MTGIFGDLQPASSGGPARWVFDALHPFDAYNVGAVVPPGFSAYVALAHGEQPDDDQLEGAPDEHDIAVVAEVLLQSSTATPANAWFCLWDGWGWENATSGSVAVLTSGYGVDERAWMEQYLDLQRFVASAPKVGYREREYHLFRGPVIEATEFREPPTDFQAASLWWPEDRAWVVATEIDLPWTYVGGAEDTVAEVERAWPHPTRTVALTDPNRWD